MEGKTINRVAVFCGSSPGAQPDYIRAAQHLGQLLATRGIGLVYGGSRVGLMGKLAQAATDAGGEVIGVIPQALVDKGVALQTLADLRVVNSMHERKALMAELADGFIALPGGLGTIEEFLEMVTWGQLGLHDKPCGALNVCRYFDRLLSLLDSAVEEKFMMPEHRAMVLVHENPEKLLDLLDQYEPPAIDKAKWILSINDM